jgi:hypothetical protein
MKCDDTACANEQGIEEAKPIKKTNTMRCCDATTGMFRIPLNLLGYSLQHCERD